MDTVEPLAPHRRSDEAPVGETADVTARAQGAWVRCGLAVGDGPLREMSDVLWLQVGDYFADLRVPRPSVDGGRALGGNVVANALNQPRAFSGTVHGDGDTLVWRHDLDTMVVRPDHDDAAVVLRFADLLVHAGAGFVERWQLATTTAPGGRVYERRAVAADALDTVDVRMVRIGDDAVAVWAAPARGGVRLHRHDDGGWEVTARVGAQRLSVEVASNLPDATELARVLEETDEPVWSGRDDSRWVAVPV